MPRVPIRAMPGDDWHIAAGDYRADVSAIGASLRTLKYQGRDLVVPFDADQLRPVFRGAIVAPWPNRLANGRYSFDGADYEVAVNELERNNALHGLVSWMRWELVEHTDDRLVLRHRLVPIDGYPFDLEFTAEFSLSDQGLTTSLTATNIGPKDAPYGCCPHPYLVAGPTPLDTWELEAPARRRLEVSADRLLPVGLKPVAEVDNDFTSPTVIGSRAIDHAFTDIDFTDGRATVRVQDRASGTGVEMSWGSWGTWLQIHTADRPYPNEHRVGLAVEPMNCPPDAFNSPDSPPVLAAGGSHNAEWVIAAI
jgi:aldose 1-epimerase